MGDKSQHLVGPSEIFPLSELSLGSDGPVQP